MFWALPRNHYRIKPKRIAGRQVSTAHRPVGNGVTLERSLAQSSWRDFAFCCVNRRERGHATANLTPVPSHQMYQINININLPRSPDYYYLATLILMYSHKQNKITGSDLITIFRTLLINLSILLLMKHPQSFVGVNRVPLDVQSWTVYLWNARVW